MVTSLGRPSVAWTTLSGAGLDTTAATAGDRARRYAYLDAWDSGEVFAPAANPALVTFGAVLKADLRLYRWTRLVYNPVPELNDFWAAAAYPGVLTRDGQPLPDGTPSAIPFPQDTDKALVAAASQVWWWSNMAAQKTTIPRVAAEFGNALITVEDDIAARQVYLRARKPVQVRAITVDSSGDVDAYSLEYPVREVVPGTELLPEPQYRTYVYRLDVTKAEYATFRDGAPFQYPGSPGARWRNPYGFVPAAWVPHMPGDWDIGTPAIRAGLQELLEINSLQSMLDDGVGRATKPMAVFITDGAVELAVPQQKREGSASRMRAGLPEDDSDRESHVGIKLPLNSSFGKLDPSGDIAAIAAYLQQRKLEWKQKYPELSMWESLRERDVSGIAAEILHGDTTNKVLAVRPMIDRQLTKATQMAISIAIMRLGDGSWRAPLTSAQEVFAGFPPDAWEQGQLDFEIAPRPVIPAPPLEQEEQAQLADILINQLGVSPEYALTLINIPARFIKLAVEAKAQAAATAAAISGAPSVAPTGGPPAVPTGLPSSNGAQLNGAGQHG